MLVNYSEKNDAMQLETLYEQNESLTIGKSICNIYLPDNCADDKCICTFYNKNSDKLFDIQLSNKRMYAFYKNKQLSGLEIAESDKYLVLRPRYSNHGNTICYSMKSYQKLWENNCFADSHFYIYNDKLFYYGFPTKSKAVLGVADINNPHLQSKLLSFLAKESPYLFRLDQDYLLLYCSGQISLFNMCDEKLYLSNIFIQEPSEFFRLDKVAMDNNVKLYFSEFKQIKESRPYEWIQECREISKSELFRDLKIIPAGSKIPKYKKHLQLSGVFAIKTEKGYGIFQKIGKTNIDYMQPFFAVYYNTVKTINNDSLQKALSGDYYISRIGLDTWNGGFDENKMLKHKKHWFLAKNAHYYGGSKVAYLGEFECNAVLPKLTRSFEPLYYSEKYNWVVHDEESETGVLSGKKYVFNKLNEDIEHYPNFYAITPKELLDHFDNNFRHENFNDDWAMNQLEKYYKENPYMRPSGKKLEDVVKEIPTKHWKENNKNDDKYLKFCDSVEQQLNMFTNGIIAKKQTVLKMLKTLITALNKIEKETGYFGTMESENTFAYIAKVLNSTKNTKLIETLNSTRKW